MKQMVFAVALIVFAQCANSHEDQEKTIKRLQDRVEILEKQLDLVYQMTVSVSNIAEQNQKLSKLNGKLMKELHPRELAGTE